MGPELKAPPALVTVGAWSRPKIAAAVLGAAIVLVGAAAITWWLHHAPQAVLFSDLSERDASVLTAELDKLKQTYSLSEDGRSISVNADQVHRVRMAVMGKPLPLHGAVGFELFNNTDLGASDFVQKVNYQRALQGELTRTILSIDQVQDVRLHLTLPDQTLFRKDAQRAKASVVVALKGGHALRPDQVMGIQRLIAASAPDIKAEDVAVLDQFGVVLSQRIDEHAAQASGQLDAKQALETYLARKTLRLLDQLLAPGEAAVAVDVSFNHDQSRVTTEEVLGTGENDHANRPVGVVTRERTVVKDPPAEGGANTAAQLQTQEFDYQVGKRTSHVVSLGGQIARLNVAVALKRTLDEAEATRIRSLLTSALGIQPSRGDTVTVQGNLPAVSGQTASDMPHTPSQDNPAPMVAAGEPARSPNPDAAKAWAMGAITVLLVSLGLGLAARQSFRARAPRPLTPQQREALLATLRRWLEAHP